MEWTVDERDEETVWTRNDGYAVVRLRRTACGEWAVSLDRLKQAPDGETYRHDTFADQEIAERKAEALRD